MPAIVFHTPMKTTLNRCLVIALAAAVAVPAALAAKADAKKKKNEPAATGPTVSFARADKDKNGAITKSEYVAAMTSSIGEEAAGIRFGELDRNFDAQLSPQEYSAVPPPEPKKGKKK